MKKAWAVVLLVCVLLTLFAPAALAAVPDQANTEGLGETADDWFSDLGNEIRNGGKDLWSAFKEYLSEHTSSEVADHLKTIFRETETLTDEELRRELNDLAGQLSIKLSDTQLGMVVRLIRKLEKLDVDRLRQQAEEWKNNAPDWDDLERSLDRLEEIGQQVQDTAREVKGFFGKVKEFFEQVGDFFDGLF